MLCAAVCCVLGAQVGLVFQFPERHFLGDDVMQEMTFTWPRAKSHWGQRQAMAVRMQQVGATWQGLMTGGWQGGRGLQAWASSRGPAHTMHQCTYSNRHSSYIVRYGTASNLSPPVLRVVCR